MRLRYEKETDYQNWCHRVMRLSWWFVLLVAIVCITLFVVEGGGGAQPVETICIMVVVPVVACTLILGGMQLASNYLLVKRRFSTQSVLYVCGISLVCLLLVWLHSQVPAIYTLFTIPVVLSLVYSDRYLLRGTFAINILLFAVFAFALPPTYLHGTGKGPEPVELIIAGAIMIVGLLMAEMILTRQQELEQVILDAHHQNRLDSLTQLYNHATFYERLDEQIMNHNRSGEGFCLVIIDIDNFKSVNDRYGHAVGDRVIMALVESINHTLGEEDEAFRYGGEEFTILTACTSGEDAEALAAEILEDFKIVMRHAAWCTEVTASAGVCCYDAGRFGAKREFFAAADEALYEAKRTGKDKVVVWSEQLNHRGTV